MSSATHSPTSWKVLFPILFGFFVMGFVDMVGVATSYVKEDFALSDTLASLISMMVFLWFGLFSIPAGLWMGKYGKRNTVLLSFALTALAMLPPLVMYHFYSILLAFALLGIGNTILQVSLNPMVAQIVHPSRVTSTLTLGQFIKAISSFLAPVLTSAVASFFGNWKLVFAVYVATTLLSILWLWFAVPPTPHQQEEKQQTSLSSILALFKDSTILSFFFGILCVVGLDVGLNITIPKLLKAHFDLPLDQAVLGTSLYFIARTGGTFLGSILLIKFSGRLFLRYSVLLALLAIIAMMVAPNLFVMGTAIVAIGLACANVFSIIFSFALTHRPQQQEGVSALMIMGVSGGALFPVLMGFFSDSYGQTAGLFPLVLCILYLGVIALRQNERG